MNNFYETYEKEENQEILEKSIILKSEIALKLFEYDEYIENIQR
jgi:hypothetical protein